MAGIAIRRTVDSSVRLRNNATETTEMEIPDALYCLFTAQLEQRDGSYVIELPERELHQGALEHDETYRVAILSADANEDEHSTAPDPTQPTSPDEPPVEPGDRRVVEIESLGDQGDGIARVDRGFVLIVPETEPRERVEVKITDVRESLAFADVVERFNHYE